MNHSQSILSSGGMGALHCQAVCLPTCQSGRLHIWITVIKTVTTLCKGCVILGAVIHYPSLRASVFFLSTRVGTDN